MLTDKEFTAALFAIEHFADSGKERGALRLPRIPTEEQVTRLVQLAARPIALAQWYDNPNVLGMRRTKQCTFLEMPSA